MPDERTYKSGYKLLRFFHWAMFFIMVEIMFCCAGWMIFGGIGMILDNAIGSSEPEPSQDFFRFLGTAGKVIGLVAGVLATRFALGRYTEPNRGEPT